MLLRRNFRYIALTGTILLFSTTGCSLLTSLTGGATGAGGISLVDGDPSDFSDGASQETALTPTDSEGTSSAANNATGTSTTGTGSTVTPSIDGGSTAPTTSDPSTPEALPQASIPTPEAVPETVPTLALSAATISSPDRDSQSVMQGSGFNDDYMIIATNTTAEASARRDGTSSTWFARAEKFVSGLQSAFATDGSSSDSCPAASSTVTRLQSVGGVLAPSVIPNVNPGDVISFTYCNPETGAQSTTAATDSPNENLIYLAQAASNSDSVSVDSNTVYQSDSDGTVTTIAYDSALLRLIASGNFDNNQLFGQMELTSGTVAEIDYFPASSYLIVNTNDDADNMLGMSISGSTYISVGLGIDTYCLPDDGCRANRTIVRGDHVFFSSEFSESKAAGEDTKIFDFLTTGADHIDFTTTSPATIDYDLRTTLAFDVQLESDETTVLNSLSLFENESGNIILSGKYLNFSNNPISENLSSTTTASWSNLLSNQILDLAITTNQEIDDGITDGKAVVLTTAGLQFLDFDLYDLDGEEDPTDGTGFTPGNFVSISNAISMTIDSSKTYAYVLSNGADSTTTSDDTVTRVSLTDGTSSTYDLSSSFVTTTGDRKTLSDLNPTTIALASFNSSDYIVVGSASQASAILVPTSRF